MFLARGNSAVCQFCRKVRTTSSLHQRQGSMSPFRTMLMFRSHTAALPSPVYNDPLPSVYCSPPRCACPYVLNSLAQVSLCFISSWYHQEHSSSPMPKPPWEPSSCRGQQWSKWPWGSIALSGSPWSAVPTPFPITTLCANSMHGALWDYGYHGNSVWSCAGLVQCCAVCNCTFLSQSFLT